MSKCWRSKRARGGGDSEIGRQEAEGEARGQEGKRQRRRQRGEARGKEARGARGRGRGEGQEAEGEEQEAEGEEQEGILAGVLGLLAYKYIQRII